MENIKNYKEGPERKIQNALMRFLTDRGWYVIETHGNMYQRGLPDLFATHQRYGGRWIEVKNADQFCFTPAQLETFPKFTSNGTGIWILVAANQEEYEKLFKPANWGFYLRISCIGMR